MATIVTIETSAASKLDSGWWRPPRVGLRRPSETIRRMSRPIGKNPISMREPRTRSINSAASPLLPVLLDRPDFPAPEDPFQRRFVPAAFQVAIGIQYRTRASREIREAVELEVAFQDQAARRPPPDQSPPIA